MEERPLKRQRLEEVIEQNEASSAGGNNQLSTKYLREAEVGITEFICPEIEGFDCILKYK